MGWNHHRVDSTDLWTHCSSSFEKGWQTVDEHVQMHWLISSTIVIIQHFPMIMFWSQHNGPIVFSCSQWAYVNCFLLSGSKLWIRCSVLTVARCYCTLESPISYIQSDLHCAIDNVNLVSAFIWRRLMLPPRTNLYDFASCPRATFLLLWSNTL